ncbi:unnamed protein product [Brassicogethes aeneus]|uniref:poly(A)-specific ribonuclease n=1 Tax=Brassicogethes aeneus TaxID=1431903 RepID=A0A9P0FF75_BRAAE|nr:unnamed protein product [Brassicogethes aeneus]
MNKFAKYVVFIQFVWIFGCNGQCYYKSVDDSVTCDVTDLTDINSIEEKETALKIHVEKMTTQTLPSEAFEYPLCNTVKISGNVENLNKNTFGNLKDLKVLDLKGNKIAHIPNDFFPPLRKLTDLDLSHNDLPSPTLDTFYKMDIIKTLNLGFNKIRRLVLGVLDEAQPLEVLLLNNNHMSNLELGIFDQLINLLKVDLSYNKITVIPLGIFDKSKSIIDLNLVGNNLHNIPLGSFDLLVNLQTLWLSKNNMESIKLGILDELRSLQYLYLNNNPIKAIPEGLLDELPNLKLVSLSNCSLNNLPEKLFYKNPNLKTIDVSLNKIQVFNNKFVNNKKFTNLNISHNQLVLLNQELFQNTNLKTLDISYNNLQDLNPNLIRLKILKLYIKNNKIVYLDPKEFKNLNSQLKYLNIKNNKLNFLDDAIFKELNGLDQIEFTGNPWICKCLEKMLILLQAHQITYQKDKYFNGKQPICIASTDQCTNTALNVDIYRFQTIRSDRTDGYGGVAILIKNNIKHTQINNFKFNNNRIQQITIKMGSLNIIGIYCPPQDKIPKNAFYSELNGQLLIMGDLNAHHNTWGSAQVNHNGKIIFEFIKDKNLIVTNDHSTMFAKSIVSAELATKSSWMRIPDCGFSDHLSTFITVFSKNSKIIKN